MGTKRKQTENPVETPRPAKSVTRTPATPVKPRKTTSRDKSELSSVARSLTPLFNGFKAARDRASQLGGRFAKKTRPTTTRKSNLGLCGSESKVAAVTTGTAVTRRTERRTGGGAFSVHTGDVAHSKEVRVLRFDKLLGEGGQDNRGKGIGSPKRRLENLR